MIIYNVTCNITEESHEKWLDWMQHTHIPAMIATGKFSKARLVKVLVEEEMGGVTYAVQYFTDCRETLERYYAEDAFRMREEGRKLFGDDVLYFRTELQIISDHGVV